MKRPLSILWIICMIAVWMIHSQTTLTPGAKITGATMNQLGGPPNYLGSRTDTTTCQPNVTAPSLGTGLLGAGTIVLGDNCFSNPILRVTDNAVNPTKPGLSYGADGSGSSEVNLWNANSTCFYVSDSGGGAVPYTFNPANMTTARLYVSSYPSTNGIIFNRTVGYPYDGGWMGHGGGCLFYGMNRSVGHLESVDLTSVTPPTPTNVKDFTTSDCLGSAPSAGAIGGIDASDNRFMYYGGAGLQNTWPKVSVYDRSLGGCSTLDMTTGTVSGSWGTTGTVSLPDRFALHNVRMSLSGLWAQVSQGNCLTTCTAVSGTYYWQIGTTNVIAVTNVTSGQSHKCNGFQTMWNESSVSGGFMQYYSRPFTALSTSNTVNAPLGKLVGSHTSCNNENFSDTLPIFDSNPSNQALNAPVLAAWDMEVIGVKNDGSGQVVRFAHTYTHEFLASSFDASQAIGSISQDGRFLLFSTYWYGTFGRTDGINNTCTYAAGGNCRGDAVIVQLN